jgi:hypothetical protein
MKITYPIKSGKFHQKFIALFFLGTVLLLQQAGAQIVAWDASGQSSFGTNPMAPTSLTTGITASTGLTRTGIGTGSTPAGGAWGGAGGWATTAADNGSISFAITVSSGYSASITSVTSLTRRSGSGPTSCHIQASVNNGAYIELGTWSTSSTNSTGTPNSTSISNAALQNMAAGTVVKFRITEFSVNTGNWYLTGANALKVFGSVSPVAVATPPTVTVAAVSGITATTAVSGGNVTSAGSAPVTARGIVWGTAANPTIAGNATSNGTGTGSFSSNLTPLLPNARYFYRAYATNSAGTSYATPAVTSFITLAEMPGTPLIDNSTTQPETSLDLVIDPASNTDTTRFAIHETSTNQYVQSNGTLGTSVVWQTENSWNTPGLAVTGLNAGTQYCFEVKARNSANTETSFSPSACISTAATAGTISNVTVSVSGPFCNGQPNHTDISFNDAGFNGSPVFTAQLSDASGSFAGTPLTIGSGTATPIDATIPTGLSPSANYKVRVISGSVQSAASTQDLTLLANPAGSIAGSDICIGGQAQLTFTATAGLAPFSLIINSSTYSGVTSGTAIDIIPNQASGTVTYNLTKITDSNGCILEN